MSIAHHRAYIHDLDPHEAIEYLMDVIKGRSRAAIERYARIRDEIPAAEKRGIIVLDMLWQSRPRVLTYDYLCQEIEYQADTYPSKGALSAAVKRLRMALAETKHPIEIKSHYGMGYSVDAPADWNAPWEVKP